KGWTNQNLFGFEKIIDFSYSGDGRNLIFSAVQKGQSDLFTYTITSSSYEQLTNDIYDDLYPGYIENSGKIIFSSNRPGDTLTFGNRTIPAQLDSTYDIFIFNLATRSPVLRRVTRTPMANEIQPMEYGKNYFAYLSDGNGIYNEYIGRLDSAVAYVDTAVHYRYFTQSFPITNYSRSIVEHHISPRAGMKTWIISQDMYDYLYYDDLLLVNSLQPVSLENTYYMDQLQATLEKDTQNLFLEDQIIPEEGADEVQPSSLRRKSFRNVMRDDTFFIDTGTIVMGDDGKIDIDNYRLDNQGFVDFNMPDSLKYLPDRFKDIKDKEEKGFVLPKQRNYNVEFSINQLVTQIDFSYLNQTYQPYAVALSPGVDANIGGFDVKPAYSDPGLSPTFKVGVTDLMENYRIMGGVRLSLDLINKEYFVNYSNLKNRLDKEFVFQRRSLEETVYSAFVTRTFTNEGFFIATWPFNRVLRVRGTVLFRNENYVFTGPDELWIAYPNINQNWGGAKAQLIYDDTKNLGLNLYEGTRFMVFGEYNQMIEEGNRNLVVFGFDFRNYKRLHRQFIWANRIAGSTNFGKERLLYYMGGTDSWMIPSFDQETPMDHSMNWMYQTLATNMRGFNQNARNGNNFILINSEFRLPVFRYLLNRPLQSEFMHNFQVVAFGDVGTAWSGWNPYDENNALYTRYENFGPLRIKVQYEKDPIIGGLGIGARTKLLGYFMKADLAWGIEDGKIKKTPKFYVSMSLDF
nr:PD40 domain-containing protein [Bacteroidota bacterium]